MPGKHRQRLDEILVAQHLISEAAIKEALMRQKAHGGKFGSQLLYHRYIDEAALVKALSLQLGCEGIAISRLEVPREVIAMIPLKVALARKVIPFEYEAATNCLKIACEDPTDHGLLKELAFVARGKDIKAYVAAEIALNTAIAHYYLGRDRSLDANLLLEIPDDATRAGGAPGAGPAGSAQASPDEEVAKCVLIATDEEFAASLLQSLLEREGYEVTVADSPAAAIDRLAKQQFHTVFIRDSLAGGATDLETQARKNAPGTVIRRFKSISHLVLNEPKEIEVELLLRNLDLLVSLLASRAKLPVNHGGLVGQYADRLCRKLRLAERDRLVVTDAAYLHDLARFYYGVDDPEDHRKIIQLTVKLLVSLNYPAPVTDVLRNMYADVGGDPQPSRPFEALGGNILTAVDLLCNAIPHDGPLSLDRFDAVKRKLRDLAGKLLSAEIVEGLIEMVQDDILNVSAAKRSIQILLYCDDPTVQRPLELRFGNEGFVAVPVTSMASLVELYERSEPDLVVLVAVGKAPEVVGLVDHLAAANFRFDLTPVFLVTEGSSVSGLTGMLDRGVEDIVGLEDNLDLLVSKIQKLAARMCASAKPEAQDGLPPGAQGRLADISLIDLIQALGPGGRTVRITVAPDAYTTKKMIVCLDQGRIIYAAFDDLAGAEAVYEGLTWTDGAWHVEPIAARDLPAPNNDLSNEAILMEGCRLLDERVKAGRLL